MQTIPQEKIPITAPTLQSRALMGPTTKKIVCAIALADSATLKLLAGEKRVEDGKLLTDEYYTGDTSDPNLVLYQTRKEAKRAIKELPVHARKNFRIVKLLERWV